MPNRPITGNLRLVSECWSKTEFIICRFRKAGKLFREVKGSLTAKVKHFFYPARKIAGVLHFFMNILSICALPHPVNPK